MLLLSSYANLAAANTVAVAAGLPLYIDIDTTLTASLTGASAIACEMVPAGGVITRGAFNLQTTAAIEFAPYTPLFNAADTGTLTLPQTVILTPFNFGALGNDSNDDTASINAMLAQPCGNFFPAAVYKITGFLPKVVGTYYNGIDCAAGACIKQYTDNMPVFVLTGSKAFFNLPYIVYVNAQSQTAYDANAVLATGSGLPLQLGLYDTRMLSVACNQAGTVIYSCGTVADTLSSSASTGSSTIVMSHAATGPEGSYGWRVGSFVNLSSSAPLSSLTCTGLVATATTTTAHGQTGTVTITISGVTPSGYNGTFLCTVTSSTTFTYPLNPCPGSSASAGTYTVAQQTRIAGVSASTLTLQSSTSAYYAASTTQVSVPNGGFFSNTIVATGASSSCYFFVNLAVGSTQNHWLEAYCNNPGPGDISSPSVSMNRCIYTSSTEGDVWDMINIEHAAFTGGDWVVCNACTSVVIKKLHIEGCRNKNSGYCGIFGGTMYNLRIDHATISYTTVLSSDVTSATFGLFHPTPSIPVAPIVSPRREWWVGSLSILSTISDVPAQLFLGIDSVKSASLSSLSWAASVVTATASAAHGLAIGSVMPITITDALPNGYNGTYLCTITTTTAFTYPLASNPGAETVPGIYTAPNSNTAIRIDNYLPSIDAVFPRYRQLSTPSVSDLIVQIGNYLPSGAIGVCYKMYLDSNSAYLPIFMTGSSWYRVTKISLLRPQFDSHAGTIGIWADDTGTTQVSNSATQALTGLTGAGTIVDIPLTSTEATTVRDSATVPKLYAKFGTDIANSTSPGSMGGSGTYSNTSYLNAGVGGGNSNTCLATLTFTAAHGLAIGNIVVISGATNSVLNGTWEVMSVPSATQIVIPVFSSSVVSGAAETGANVYLRSAADVVVFGELYPEVV